MSEHHHASEAVYHPIPQGPVASDVAPTSSLDDLDDDVASSNPHSIHSQVPIDSRIRWIHFVLGCAVLLPWNGACSRPQTYQFLTANVFAFCSPNQ